MDIWAFIYSLQNVLQPTIIGYLVIGTVLGIIAGAIPSFSATMAVTLALPITFYMADLPGISLLLGIYVGGISGGLIASILLNMPGTPSSVATTFDGYPMKEKGEALKALKIGTFCSLAGGVAGAIVLIFLAPNLAALALSFQRYEYFALMVFAMTTVVVLAKGQLYKGLVAALLGLFIATIGTDPISGSTRLTFGFPQLSGGVGTISPLLGLFAISQALEDIRNLDENSSFGKLAKASVKKFELLKYIVKNSKKHIFNFIRSSIIGVILGILPGVGPATSSIVSYAEAKRSSKKPEEFGKGSEEGLISAEIANNATLGGAMVPLLAFGIPGDGVTAVLLAGLMLKGIRPGPLLLRDRPEVLYGILLIFLLAKICMFFIQMSSLPLFMKAAVVPTSILIPIILVLSVIGAFAINNRFFDVWIMFIFGIFGYYFKQSGYPLLPTLIGIILGPLLERNLRQALMDSSGSLLPFLQRPITLSLLVLSVLFTLFVLIKDSKKVGA